MLFGEGTDLAPQELPQIALGGRRGRVDLALRKGLEEPYGDPAGSVCLARGISTPRHGNREIPDRSHESLNFFGVRFTKDLFAEPNRVLLVALEIVSCPISGLKRGQQIVEELGLL